MLGETTIFPTPVFIFATSISESSGLCSHCQRIFFIFRFLPTYGKCKLSFQIKRVFLLWWPAWQLWSQRCKGPGLNHLQVAKYRASPTNFLDLYGINLSLCTFRVVHTFRQSPSLPKVFHKVLEALVSERALIQLLPVERLVESPASINSTKNFQANFFLFCCPGSILLSLRENTILGWACQRIFLGSR
jgi:hypothetical protein